MHEKTSAAAYGASSFVAGLGMLDWNTICMVGGLVLGILTFAVNWYYKRENAKVYRDALMKGVHVHGPKD